jgi:predicted phage terminase large subunit-like protein
MTALAPVTPQELVQIGAKSLVGFGRVFFPKTLRQDSPEFHGDIGKLLYSPSRFNAIEVFRGGAKTSLLRVFTAQRVGYAISRTIMYVSISQDHAKHSVRWLKRHVIHNALYRDVFQLSKGDKWTDELITINHGIDQVPITVMAAGITGQIRGFNLDDYRPDLIIIDDALNEENTATKQQRQKIDDLLFGALLNSLAPTSEAPHAKAVFLQTPLDAEDAVETCMKDPMWNGVRFGIFDENGNSRWESRFPTAEYKQLKASAMLQRRHRQWMREMECTIVAGEDQIFDVSRLQYWDVLPDMFTVIAIDPASSESADADDTAIVVVGFSGPNIYILDYFAERGAMPDLIASKFFEFVWKYRPRKLAVETVAYQRVLKWYLEQEMVKRKTFVACDAVQDRRKKSDRIIQALAGALHLGLVWARPQMDKLIQQLDRYNPEVDREHDDVIDAIAMAITSANPALRDVEAEYTVLDEADEYYKPVAIEVCP